MYIDLDDNQTYMSVYTDYKQELDILSAALTVEIPDAFILKRLCSVKNTEQKFINSANCIPIGLWVEVLKICKKNNIIVQMSDKMITYLNGFNFDYDEFIKYVKKTFNGAKTKDGNPFCPYDYQIEAAYKLIKYKKCCAELSTSSGKTLISFIIFKYLFDVKKIKKILYVVPNVNLATQSEDDYEKYEKCLKKHNHNWKTGILYSKLSKEEKKNVDNCNILFGTFQSLCRKKLDFFSDFNVCIIDECHHSSSKSIRNILIKCCNLEYSFGLTGTFPKEHTYENMIIQSYIGPLIHKFTADQLINEEKRGTPIYIVFQYLRWGTMSEKQELWRMRKNKDSSDISAGSKCLRKEQNMINSSYTRMKYISDLAIKTKQNTLILFGDIKNGYGKDIYNYIKDNSEKSVYYADGTTKPEVREWIKQQMEDDMTGNTVIVFSSGIAAEGLDLKNLWAILLVMSIKSSNKVRQICGRGLRLFPGKDRVVLFDFVDDLRYSDEHGNFYENYSYKHGKERKKIYIEQKFPVYEQKIDFETKSNVLI
jgi:superfamily II DNA or RNA helicase